MKKNYLITIFALFCFSASNAQLKVTSDGDVGIGTSIPERRLHIKKAHSTPLLNIERTGSDEGKVEFGVRNDIFYLYPGGYSSGCEFYVTSTGRTGLLATHWTGGLRIDDFNHEGHHMPALYPNSNWYGSLGRGWNSRFGYAYIDRIFYDELTDYSDLGIKENVQELTNASEKIKQLRPVKYDIKKSFYDSIPMRDKTMFYDRSKGQVGLIAQEVQTVFPELVTNDETNGLLGVNYIDFIPYLIAVSQEQQHIIETQQQQINELNTLVESCCKTDYYKKSGNSETVSSGEYTSVNSSLQQNIPNPFTQNTQINFYIAESVKSANLYIYNMQGHQVDHFDIQQTGSGNITISGNTMQAGMYLYTLFVDKQEVDTKKMILTE